MPKRGELIQGELLFGKRKSILKKGENLSSLEMLLKILFFYFRPNANDF
jgi:hypothetical protein